MSLTLKESTCVARGTFNIYIFQPEWLTQFLDLPAEAAGQLSADFSQPGLQASFFEGKLTWTIRPDGIIVGATSVEHDCGAIIARVLAALPVTPMRAVGSNFSYAGDVGAIPPGTELAEALRDSSVEGLVSTSVSKSLQRGGVTYNVGVTRTGDAVHLTVNVHREVDAGKNGVEPAFAFKIDRENSSALAREIFGIEVVADGE